MNRMRMRIAERLKESQNSAASLTTFNEIDMSSLMSFRSKYKDEVLKRHNVKIGFMSAFAKACVLALQEIPAANASIENAADGKGQEIVYRDYVDLSVAVATPKGLVTPVVRNAEELSMIGVEREIAALGSKARDGKLTLEDMAGGTFTMYGFVFVCVGGSDGLTCALQLEWRRIWELVRNSDHQPPTSGCAWDACHQGQASGGGWADCSATCYGGCVDLRPSVAGWT